MFQYALAVAACSEDGSQRTLGPIHLLKYAYLGDLAHAEQSGGVTFTGIAWRFHHFGPWSEAARARIDPSLAGVDADRQTFTSRQRDDHVRYGLPIGQARQVAAQLDHELPSSVRHAITRAVHEHGSDTADLLRHVYLTPPMLAAKPGDRLDFAAGSDTPPPPPSAAPPPPKRSRAEKARRAAVIAEGRRRVKQMLAATRAKRVALDPPPRYDEVFFEGTAQLDREAGAPLRPSSGRLEIDPSVWSSSQRRESDVP